MTQIFSYKVIFQHLLPQGMIWQKRDPLLEAFAVALGDELDLLYQKFQEMKINLNPADTSALLDEWERDTALPDECLTYSANETKRRENILVRLYERTGSNLTWLNHLLQKIDNHARAEEIAAGTLKIYYSDKRLDYARVGEARAGDYLLETVKNKNLLCHLKRKLSADLKLIFQYYQQSTTKITE